MLFETWNRGLPCSREQWLADNYQNTVRTEQERPVGAMLTNEEELVLRCLGAAMIMQWNTVPAKLQRELFDNAGPIAEYRQLGSRFGQDPKVSVLQWRSVTLWILGYAEATHADVEQALSDAREIGHAATVIFALVGGARLHLFRRDFHAAKPYLNKLASFAGEKGALLWKSYENDDDWLSIISSRRPRRYSTSDRVWDRRRPLNRLNLE